MARMFSILTLYDLSSALALPAGTSWYLNMFPVAMFTDGERVCRWQAGGLPMKSAGALRWSSSKAIASIRASRERVSILEGSEASPCAWGGEHRNLLCLIRYEQMGCPHAMLSLTKISCKP